VTADILDELFHGCAWQAFITEARAAGTWPDPETTRQTAYSLYEEELAARSGRPHQPLAVPADPAYPPQETAKEPAP